MANKVLLKRSSVAGKTPIASDLEYGELALNYNDGVLYYKDTSNTIQSISGSGGGSATTLDGLTDVTVSTAIPSQLVYYDGTEWKNEYKYNIVPNVPFTKEDGTEQFLDLINARDLTTVSGFLNNIVTQSYYLPFTKADGSYVTTLVLG